MYQTRPSVYLGIDTGTDTGRYWAWAVDEARAVAAQQERERREADENTLTDQVMGLA